MPMGVFYYDVTEVDFSRKVVSVECSDAEAYIHYEDDDGTEMLFVTAEDMAEALVEMWNEAIEEDDRLQIDLDYKSGVLRRIGKEIDQKDDLIKRLQEENRKLKAEIGGDTVGTL